MSLQPSAPGKHHCRYCIVAKNLENDDITQTPDPDLRPLTNELGGRLDYGHPFCIFHAWCRCMSKALMAFLSLQARSSSSPQRCSMLMAALRSACAWKPQATQQNVCWSGRLARSG